MNFKGVYKLITIYIPIIFSLMPIKVFAINKTSAFPSSMTYYYEICTKKKVEIFQPYIQFKTVIEEPIEIEVIPYDAKRKSIKYNLYCEDNDCTGKYKLPKVTPKRSKRKKYNTYYLKDEYIYD